MIESIIFYGLATITVIPAILVVSQRNIFHSALWLVLCLLGVGGIFAMLAADFLFGVQILVYAGGITVVLLFVVMLSGKPSDWVSPVVNDKAWGAFLFSVMFVAVIVTSLHSWAPQAITREPILTTGALGELLFRHMLLPLEVIGLVMVVGLVGAIYFSSKRFTR